MQIDWMVLLQYVLGLAGAGVLGGPMLKKAATHALALLNKLRTPTPAPMTLEVRSELQECCGDIERVTAESLLNSAFVFQMQGNQAGVEHCLKAVAELANVKPVVEEPKT